MNLNYKSPLRKAGATKSYDFLRAFLALRGFAGDFLVELERGPLLKAGATLARILRAAAWLDFRADFTCSAIFFFAAEVSMEKPLAASGAWSFRPANSQSAATLRRSSPGSSIGVSARNARPARPSGAAALR